LPWLPQESDRRRRWWFHAHLLIATRPASAETKTGPAKVFIANLRLFSPGKWQRGLKLGRFEVEGTGVEVERGI
jgi:hypothetical protein